MNKHTDIEVTTQILEELGVGNRPPRVRRLTSQLFIKGPLSLDWLKRGDVATHTLLVMLAIKLVIDVTGKEPVTIPQVVWERLGLSRSTRYRVLNDLRRAAVIRIKCKSGQAAKIWLIDKPGDRDA
jgi:hypothetical protein